MSLLQQQLSAKRSPASTQFTFTCDSQFTGAMQWPDADGRPAITGHQPPPTRVVNETWPRSAQSAQVAQPPPALPQATEAGLKDMPSKGGTNEQSPPAEAPRRRRRSAAKEYAAAANARRAERQRLNQLNPPKPEDIWICHFCEYEAIFGRPPVALVRAYEIKDRKQRLQQQERRAQWERMKKGKHKGKKPSKSSAKHSNAAQDTHHSAGTRGAPMNDNYSQGTQSENYYDDEDYEGDDCDVEEEVPLDGVSEVNGHREAVPVPRASGTPAQDGGGS